MLKQIVNTKDPLNKLLREILWIKVQEKKNYFKCEFLANVLCQVY